jgi:hypothetical protein
MLNLDNTDNIVSQLMDAVKRFGPAPSLICRSVGIHKTTFYQFMDRHVELRALYNDKVQDIIDAIEEEGIGANKLLIAQHLGKRRVEISRYIDENPDITEAFQDAEEALIDLAESKAALAVSAGDWLAVQEVLLTKGRRRGWNKSDKNTLDKEAQRLGIQLNEIVNELSDTLAAKLMAQDGDNNVAELTVSDYSSDRSSE